MSNLISTLKRNISIPDYFKLYMDNNVDLNNTTKICCPFHKEDTPSFTYSPDKGLWRCWGACKVGGDVISLHMKNHRLSTRDEAAESLASILGVEPEGLDLTPPKLDVDTNLVAYTESYNKALRKAKTVDDWIELDYIMSQHKSRGELRNDLDMFIQVRQ